MPIVDVEPQIRLICDECDEEPGNEEFGGYFTYGADDPNQALRDADYRRLDDGRIVCDNCAYELKRKESAA